MRRVNIVGGDNLFDRIPDILLYIEDHSETVRLTYERIIFMDEGKVYISSIEFDNEDECMYCCLKYGLA